MGWEQIPWRWEEGSTSREGLTPSLAGVSEALTLKSSFIDLPKIDSGGSG